jgi:hypothetical protein
MIGSDAMQVDKGNGMRLSVGKPKDMSLKIGLAEMLKGGVIMDVTTVEQAVIAERAGAVAVMALERIPADIRVEGGVSRMSAPYEGVRFVAEQGRYRCRVFVPAVSPRRRIRHWCVNSVPKRCSSVPASSSPMIPRRARRPLSRPPRISMIRRFCCV